MRTVAAAASAQFGAVSDALYAVTRHMLDDEEHWQGEDGLPWITTGIGGQTRQEGVELERIQAWLLLAHYGFMRKPELQALITTDRALRLLQLSRLFELDMDESSSSSSSSKDPAAALVVAPSQGGWIEREEKRRTMWTAFVLDRLSSMLNNRSLVLHEEIVSLDKEVAMFPHTCHGDLCVYKHPPLIRGAQLTLRLLTNFRFAHVSRWRSRISRMRGNPLLAWASCPRPWEAAAQRHRRRHRPPSPNVSCWRTSSAAAWRIDGSPSPPRRPSPMPSPGREISGRATNGSRPRSRRQWRDGSAPTPGDKTTRRGAAMRRRGSIVSWRTARRYR